MIVEATAESFSEDVSTGTVLVDFYGKTCGPCRTIGMILKASEREFADMGVKIVKVDVGECVEAAEQFGVSSIPSVHLLIDGNRVDGFVGMRTKKQIMDIVQGALK